MVEVKLIVTAPLSLTAVKLVVTALVVVTAVKLLVSLNSNCNLPQAIFMAYSSMLYVGMTIK